MAFPTPQGTGLLASLPALCGGRRVPLLKTLAFGLVALHLQSPLFLNLLLEPSARTHCAFSERLVRMVA